MGRAARSAATADPANAAVAARASANFFMFNSAVKIERRTSIAD
jgi:hypothetical protein